MYAILLLTVMYIALNEYQDGDAYSLLSIVCCAVLVCALNVRSCYCTMCI